MAFSLPFSGLNSFIGTLQRQAAGRGPSAAQQMLRNSTNTQNAQTMGQALSMRGPQSQALALRNAQRINQQRQAQSNSAGAALRAQEQQSAQGMLSPLLQQQQAANLTGLSGAIDTVNAGKGSSDSWIGAGVSMLPLLLSDERRKRIRRQQPASAAGSAVTGALQGFLRSLTPTQFTYDTERRDAPARTGVTAQDVASTPAGAQAVVNTPQGAAIDPTTIQGPVLASLGELNARLEAVESRAAERSRSTRASINRRPGETAAVPPTIGGVGDPVRAAPIPPTTNMARPRVRQQVGPANVTRPASEEERRRIIAELLRRRNQPTRRDVRSR